MIASIHTSPQNHRRGLLLTAALLAFFTSARPAAATTNAVHFDCPGLTTEQAAEIESRVRASLLTTDRAPGFDISCYPGTVEVQVESLAFNVNVKAATSPDTLREDVLRAVEQALQELLQQLANDTPPADDAPAAATENPAPLEAEPPPPAAPVDTLPPTAPPTPRAAAVPTPPPTPERSWTEFSAALSSEWWTDRVAAGGAVGVARRSSLFWIGLQAGVLRPLGMSTAFGALEYDFAADFGVEPRFARGARLALGLGPSVLVVAPHAGLTPRAGTAAAALFADAHLSRPFWWGHFGLLPDVGLRLFTRQRGVRIDAQERLTLGGLAPQVSVGFAYRIE